MAEDINERFLKMFENMLGIAKKYSLPEKGEPIYFYSCVPVQDECADMGIEDYQGEPSFCFHGSWFSNSYIRELQEPITNPEIVFKQLNALCNYQFKDYSPKEFFLNEIAGNFERAIKNSLAKVLAEKETPRIRGEIFKK